MSTTTKARDLRIGDQIEAVDSYQAPEPWEVLRMHLNTITDTVALYTSRDPYPEIYLDGGRAVTITSNEVAKPELPQVTRSHWERTRQGRWWYTPPGSNSGYLVAQEGSRTPLHRQKDWRKLPPVSRGFHRVADDDAGNRMCSCDTCGQVMRTLSIGYHRQNTGH